MTYNEIKKPEHYMIAGIEAKHLINFMIKDLKGCEAWWFGNVLKYIFRAGKKDDAIKDLKKAIEYLGWTNLGMNIINKNFDLFFDINHNKMFNEMLKNINKNNNKEISNIFKEVYRSLFYKPEITDTRNLRKALLKIVEILEKGDINVNY